MYFVSKRKLTLCSVGLSVVALSSEVFAQETNEIILEEVIVTAQRREQSLQEVPIAVTALSRGQMDKSGIKGLQDLAFFTPGLTGRKQGSSTPIFAIRGINSNSFGIGGENSVGVFLDETFIGRNSISSIGFLDVERIEVLKGPQGTLFGRNSTAGAISITSRKAGNGFEADVKLSRESFDTTDIFVGVTVPIIEDVFSVRFAGTRRSSKGYEKNIVHENNLGGEDTWAGRISTVINFSEKLSLEGFYAQWDEKTGGLGYSTTDPALASLGAVSDDPFDGVMASDLAIFENSKAKVAGVTLKYEISDHVTFKSITSYSWQNGEGLFDIDGSILPIFQALFEGEPNKTFGQEFRLSGSNDKFDWIIGASYFGESVDSKISVEYDQGLIIGGIPFEENSLGLPHPAFETCDPISDLIFGFSCNDRGMEISRSNGDYDSYAVFADLHYNVNDQLSITAGLRYSVDKKKFSYRGDVTPSLTTLIVDGGLVVEDTGGNYQNIEDKWTDLQPRFVVDYQFSGDLMGYLSITRGFKAGGFDVTTDPANVTFKAEDVWAYETGLKATVFNGKIRINSSVYVNDYNNLQIQTVVSGVTQTINVPKIDNYGFELEVMGRPLEGLDIGAGLAFNESKFSDFLTDSGNLKGNRVPLTSKWNVNLMSQYSFPVSDNVEIYIRGEANYRSREYDTLENAAEFSQKEFWTVNGRLGLTSSDHGWEVAGYVKNLFDIDYVILKDDFGFGPLAYAASPRIWGLELSKSF